MSLTTKNVSTTTLAIVSLVSISLLVLVHNSYGFNPWYKHKMEAARLMQKAQQLILAEKKAKGIIINSTDDPNGSGLIGEQYSDITTDRGILDAKVMITNPNFAAAVVDLFKKANLKKGDVVAVGYTGSMPAANIAVLAAIEVLGLRPIIISSIGASSWGATDPEMSWVDMESLLHREGLISNASVAASLGGKEDNGLGLSEESKQLMMDAIRRSNLLFINEGNLDKNIEARIKLYKKFAEGRPIRAYVNVGGSVASLGRSINGALIPPGLTRRLDSKYLGTKGVVIQMAKRGIPIIHLLKVRELVREYRLPELPVPLPNPGEAQTFYEEKYSVKIAAMAMTALMGTMAVLMEIDLFLLPSWMRRRKGKIK
ncbi:MAG: poly-gamma-glutamate system protein [Candidatus Omnitrophica bacterium]|nr:poly-gamma-glutamate system protein [Candidatus Omnitrophota bacterium]